MEKDKYHMNLLKKDANDPIYKREIVTNVQSKLLTIRGWQEGIN